MCVEQKTVTLPYITLHLQTIDEQFDHLHILGDELPKRLNKSINIQPKSLRITSVKLYDLCQHCARVLAIFQPHRLHYIKSSPRAICRRSRNIH